MGKNDKLKQFNPSATRKRQKSRENDWKSEWFFPNYFDAVLIDIKVMCILKNSDWYIFYGFGIETKVELQKWTIDNFNKFNRKNSCNVSLFLFSVFLFIRHQVTAKSLDSNTLTDFLHPRWNSWKVIWATLN